MIAKIAVVIVASSDGETRVIPPDIQEAIDDLRRKSVEHKTLSDKHGDLAERFAKAADVLEGRYEPATEITNPSDKTPTRAQLIARMLPRPSKTRSDLMASVLNDTHHPMKPVEIADAVLARGHGVDLDRSSLYNGVLTVLNRRPDLFLKHNDGTWSLTAWYKTLNNPDE